MVVFIIIMCAGIMLAYTLYMLAMKHIAKQQQTLDRNISFLSSLRLTGFPIISFENNGIYINMILDTGSTKSIIDVAALENLEYKILDADSNVYGLNGVNKKGGLVHLPFHYNKQKYSIECMSMDMTATFSKMKEQFGVTIHGILGTDFFEKYKYILDFNDMVAYKADTK